MTTQQFRAQLVSVLTAYDKRQSKGRFWNPYALPNYLTTADEVIADIQNGADPRRAICARFCDRLLAAVLKGMNLTGPSDAECRGSGSKPYYIPASAEK